MLDKIRLFAEQQKWNNLGFEKYNSWNQEEMKKMDNFYKKISSVEAGPSLGL